MVNKVTKKMLKDYIKAKKEIPLLRAELNTMNTTEAGLGSSVIFDYQKGFPRPQAIVGFDQERYNRRRSLLESKEKLVAAVEKWIDEIEDTQTRLVFKMRYKQEQRWDRIAKMLGYESADYVRIVLHDRYIDKKI